MRLDVIKNDGFVSIDGEGYTGVDLSFLPDSFHALHWFGDAGEIQWKDATSQHLVLVGNERITSLDPYKRVIDRWQAAQTAELARKRDQDALHIAREQINIAAQNDAQQPPQEP